MTNDIDATIVQNNITADFGGSGGIVYDTFLRLGDTPDSYLGQANKIVRVKLDESGLEFANETGLVTSVNGLTGAVVLTTTNISEGTNQYYTDERVDDRVSTLIQNGTGLTWTYNDASNTLTGNVSLTGVTSPGSNTQVLFNDSTAIAGDAGMTYVKTTQTFTLTKGTAGSPSLILSGVHGAAGENAVATMTFRNTGVGSGTSDIAGIRTLINTTNSINIGALAFYTKAGVSDSTLTERMRIQSAAVVIGFGSTAGVGIFSVGSNAPASRYTSVNADGEMTLRRDVSTASTSNNLTIENRDTTSAIAHTMAVQGNFARTASGTTIGAFRLIISKDQEWTSTATTQDASAKIQLAQDGTLTDVIAWNPGMLSTLTYDSVAATKTMHNLTVNFYNAGAGVPINNSNVGYSFQTNVQYGASAARSIVGGLFGITLGAGSAGGITGSAGLTALNVTAYNDSASLTVNKTVGLAMLTGASRSGGTVTTAQAVTAGIFSAGTTTNAYGFYALSPTGAGTKTNLYGLYVEDMTAGATLNYAIYTNAGLVRFGGNVTLAEGVNIVLGTTTGTKIGTVGGSSGEKLGFFNATPIVQPLLATGAGATADNIITVLQNLGLVRQS